MSKEKLKIDNELAKEFDGLIREEGRKIEPEERIQKTLWALDALKQENRIKPGTTLTELIRIIEERQRELRQTDAYAKDTAESPVRDEVGAELQKVAEKEFETAERLLGYLNAAWSVLKPMDMTAYDSEIDLGQLQARLKRDLALREANVNRDEKEKRGRKQG
ncbi:MAG: hypothetical protein A3I26_02035 [Candidatus Yanofskybacteria bacterium RIFCSPLOWO2_02_FULL_43_10]|uniref:Uncharacterized protein n=1 Tax=Candidatus Yanofskybacteria bacterium RIFCSPLOWO2_12_FULL_43_11b TaxID=1802710 RepID=A0A1F8HAF7_9BACT|nr:MAG: hypothetical protein A2742_02800 [Candidatus Yanofskybacteria bacterium RIFCSPHIGHO2_01_FULL_43_32]OGN12064.1 MAG: hypothetical protein A3C69_00565 [Candidatus Yanofskybacteria bacterium RIFCSPHIGHO2_02_FULL_43_12]OGN17561.1 MAG: hypothetical protein A3E34_03305 [Candidatus Yanofskybacteria bacterium RIFCSPHIGHO2_12_FULL_43_11]OGN25084.1 MAG: hypothetical protein A2923_01755 [Candidatus Yanofskybacteria bacterium RIFCSPLOWO2_01_FULL_43_46]OGN28739.1 MAG: hypothetical protein A3I26_02035